MQNNFLKHGFKRDRKFYIILMLIGIISFFFFVLWAFDRNTFFLIAGLGLLIAMWIFAYLSQTGLERKSMGIGPNIYNSKANISRAYGLKEKHEKAKRERKILEERGFLNKNKDKDK